MIFATEVLQTVQSPRGVWWLNPRIKAPSPQSETWNTI